MKKTVFALLVMVCSIFASFTSFADDNMPATVDATRFEAFEAGETVEFQSVSEFYSFINQYLVDYRMVDLKGGYQLMAAGNAMVTSLPEAKAYDRTAMTEKIIAKFGMPVGDTSREKICDVITRVGRIMRYDIEARNDSLDAAIENCAGVCWHSSKIEQALLNAAGVETHLVNGSMDGVKHMWLCCCVDGQNVYVDPFGGILDAAHYASHYVEFPFVSMQ